MAYRWPVFQVIMYGRFWVITEDRVDYLAFQSEDFPDQLDLRRPLSATTSLDLFRSSGESRSLESSARLHRTIENLGWHLPAA
jgi:hypothetical protein